MPQRTFLKNQTQCVCLLIFLTAVPRFTESTICKFLILLFIAIQFIALLLANIKNDIQLFLQNFSGALTLFALRQSKRRIRSMNIAYCCHFLAHTRARH